LVTKLSKSAALSTSGDVTAAAVAGGWQIEDEDIKYAALFLEASQSTFTVE
jgi:hypothetical protein